MIPYEQLTTLVQLTIMQQAPLIISSVSENRTYLYSFFILVLGYFFCSNVNYYLFDLYENIYLKIYYCQFFKSYPSEIQIKGEKINKHTNYMTRTALMTSETFKAIWDYMLNLKLKSIFALKEWSSYEFDMDEEPEFNKNSKNTFIINQSWPLYLGDEIYCRLDSKNTIRECGNHNKTEIEIEVITITLFSWTKDVYYLKDFVENIIKNYENSLLEKRKNKIYHYTIKNVHKEDEIIEMEENLFKSTKTFDNLFFDAKKDILKRVDFFLNNKDWYSRNGIPYMLGIGLHGPPGTGKTSFIKALANKTRRHIISVPLNKIKTEKAFHDCIYYKGIKDVHDEINFENKIIVLEDIDCMDKIVHQRQKEIDDENEITEDDENLTKELLKELKSTKDKTDIIIPSTNNLTLSYILNVIDGINENEGRILIITSNFYEKLDEALKRPGRIDITLQMKNASINLIKQIYKFYYGVAFPKQFIPKLKNDIISPCELVNFRCNSKNSSEYLKKILSRMD